MKTRFLTLKPSKARIEIVEAGPLKSKGGRDLLYLHGAGGHMPTDPLIAALATKNRVVPPLLPGYAQSTGEDGLPDMLNITQHPFHGPSALELKKPISISHSTAGILAPPTP